MPETDSVAETVPALSQSTGRYPYSEWLLATRYSQPLAAAQVTYGLQQIFSIDRIDLKRHTSQNNKQLKLTYTTRNNSGTSLKLFMGQSRINDHRFLLSS